MRPERLRAKRGGGLQRSRSAGRTTRGACAKQKSGSRSTSAPAGRRARYVAAERTPLRAGQLPGRHGRPHGPGLRRPQRGQVHRRAGIEQAPEVRQPPVGDRRRDEVERRRRRSRAARRARSVSLGRGHADCRGVARRASGGVRGRARASGSPMRRQRSARPRQGRRPARRAGRPRAGGWPSTTHATAQVVIAAAPKNHRLRGLVVERRAKARRVQPHQCRGGHRGAGAERRQHAYAEPPGRERLGRRAPGGATMSA